jgi:cation-transporting P-type ATPase C
MRGAERVASAVEHHLSGQAGVRAVRVFPRTGNVVVWHEPAVLDQAAIGELLATGLDVALIPRPLRVPPQKLDVEIARLVLGAAALGLVVLRRILPRRTLLGAMTLGRAPLLSARGSTAALVVSIFTGYPFVRGAVRSLSGRSGGGTDLLVTVATVASLLLRENVVALTVLWLLNIGEFLQELTLRRTRQAIEDLLSLGEDQVWLVTAEGAEIRVPLEDIAVGDLVACYEHSAIGVDGLVVDGEAVVDQAAVTGEPLPAYVSAGGPVYAGTVLVRGSLRVRVTAVGAQTTVGRIITRVEHAQTDRAPIQTVATRFSRRFVPASLALAALTFLITRDARRAMTMLLVACPCAAGLSTPTAINAAIGNGARRGILIKGGTHLEAAGRLTAIAFDKTGTLTIGRPVVTTVISFDGQWSPERVLAVAASSEIHIRHPLAEAVVRHTEGRRIEIPLHERCEVLLGLGVRVDMQHNVLLLGSPRLMTQSTVAVPDEAADWIGQMHTRAEIPLCLASDGKLVGLLGVTDAIRPQARDLVVRLADLGIGRLVMFTGDHPVAARAVAEDLGIPEWYAQVLPEAKVDVVTRLQAQGHVVATVGDGVNDAPALALADVGIAMGLSGTDVAVETADIALAGDHIEQVAAVVELGRHTLRVVRQNYALSIGVNTLGLLAAATGTLNPVLAAVLHNASSLAVVFNSARLVRYELDRTAAASLG